MPVAKSASSRLLFQAVRPASHQERVERHADPASACCYRPLQLAIDHYQSSRLVLWVQEQFSVTYIGVLEVFVVGGFVEVATIVFVGAIVGFVIGRTRLPATVQAIEKNVTTKAIRSNLLVARINV